MTDLIHAARPRLRELGVAPGILSPGPLKPSPMWRACGSAM